jgi:hypothetical protein
MSYCNAVVNGKQWGSSRAVDLFVVWKITMRLNLGKGVYRHNIAIQTFDNGLFNIVQ